MVAQTRSSSSCSTRDSLGLLRRQANQQRQADWSDRRQWEGGGGLDRFRIAIPWARLREEEEEEPGGR